MSAFLEQYRPTTMITFPGQERAIESEHPEKTLLDRILEPFDSLVGKVENLREKIIMYGNSFGFFAVLAATESMKREDAKELAFKRGEIVRQTENKFEEEELRARHQGEDITQLGRTAMMRLIQVPEELRMSIMRKYQLWESNNYGGIVVLTGRKNALDLAAQEINQPKRTAILGIHAAYHDPRRKEDSITFSQVVESTPIARPKVPILTSTNARFVEHPDDIREELVGMMVRPVKLEDIIRAIKGVGISMANDFDPNESFSKLVSRFDDAKQWLQLNAPLREIDALNNFVLKPAQIIK